MPDLYCGATVDGGLCLEPVEGTQCPVCGLAVHQIIHRRHGHHRAIPAYVRCPGCDGTKVKLHGHKEDGDWYADVCGCSYSPTPGFIPAEEVRA